MGSAVEANFDGLVGPTHQHAGLALGNQASLANRHRRANPRAAALQGINKMKALSDRGAIQGILPPQPRPNFAALRNLGFRGSDKQLLQQVASDPSLLAAFSSASAMWCANAATVSPSADSADHLLHFTAANLNHNLHRCQESEFTARVLKKIFADERYFHHHPPLLGHSTFADEGAANHHRVCHRYAERGIELFVYGRQALRQHRLPQRYPARQTYEASQAIARLHQLDPALTLFAQQHPQAIDQGVFHNDVIAVGNQQLLFCHQQAFVQQAELFKQLTIRADQLAIPLQIIELAEEQVSVAEAVESYLFNSQLVTLTDGRMLMVVPNECQQQINVWRYIGELVDNDEIPISEVISFDLQESMRNGGGPACLRLRVVLTDQELAAVNPGCLMTEARFQQLVKWVYRHYPDQLSAQDLADPELITLCYQALDELTQILQLGSIYDFQR